MGGIQLAGRLAVYLLGAAAVLAVIGVTLWLLLPPLLSPVPEEQPGYDFLAVEDAVSGMAGPASDLLLETADRRVSLFVPQGAVEGDTTIVLQPRDLAQVPDLVVSDVERRFPVDIYGTTTAGEALLIVALQKPTLLCFRPDEDTRTLAEEGMVALMVQRYDDLLSPQEWIDLPVVPGWEDGQVCAQTDHFSLFALGLRAPTAAVPHTLPDATPTAATGLIDLYAIPTPTP